VINSAVWLPSHRRKTRLLHSFHSAVTNAAMMASKTLTSWRRTPLGALPSVRPYVVGPTHTGEGEDLG
jgi:hypothetical protein